MDQITNYTKLHAIFNDPKYSANEILLKDMFAIGCYLISLGSTSQVYAGEKMIREVGRFLKTQTEKNIYFEIIPNIKGLEKEYALAVRPHNEINLLFDPRASELIPKS